MCGGALARGGLPVLINRHASGSIPACAGEPRSQESPGRVYPRVCGGATYASGITVSQGNSSGPVECWH